MIAHRMPPERIPTQITLHQKSRVLEIAFSDGRGFRLPYEYLRVYSPSAEVRGHGPGQEVLQTGKRNVEIRSMEAVGSYAVQPVFSDGRGFSLPYEYLRVYSPSAEVRGHGPGQEVLQTGKRNVEIRSLEAVGSYAVQPVFSDGHSTGIYSWDYLYDLGEEQDRLWAEYLKKLESSGGSRDK